MKQNLQDKSDLFLEKVSELTLGQDLNLELVQNRYNLFELDPSFSSCDYKNLNCIQSEALVYSNFNNSDISNNIKHMDLVFLQSRVMFCVNCERNDCQSGKKQLEKYLSSFK